MTIEPEETQTRSELAETLRQLRKAAGLSGERLAARCLMSQAKISRIERAKATPSVVDVQRIISALEVPSGPASDLLALARRANVEHTSLRALAESGLWRRQNELRSLTESCTVQREFLPALPSGLLQTADYARRALSPKVPSSPKRDVERAVTARLDRQAALADPSKCFVFLLTEQAVRAKRANRAVMAEQCEHIAELSERSNIDIEIIPQTACITGPALNTFVVYDDRLVIAELFSGDVAIHDYRDVVYHLELFALFRESALTGQRAKSFLLATRDEFM